MSSQWSGSEGLDAKMARILSAGEWFDQIAPTSLYETELERIILQHAPLLYPDYYMVSFKVSVSSNEDIAKPDFALIQKSYRDWYVVEVEMENHSFHGHVLPQVGTLSNAYYGDKEAEAIYEKFPGLDLRRIQDMIKGKQPRVLVIVNAPKQDWISQLEMYNADLAVFEIFRSDKNEHVFRINGYYPKSVSELVSICYFDELLPNLLIVESPALIRIARGEIVKIKFENYISEWKKIESMDKVWLVPVSSNPLSYKLSYKLYSEEDGSFFLKPI